MKTRNKDKDKKGINISCPDNLKCDIHLGYQNGQEIYYCCTCKKERNDYKNK